MNILDIYQLNTNQNKQDSSRITMLMAVFFTHRSIKKNIFGEIKLMKVKGARRSKTAPIINQENFPFVKPYLNS